MLDVLKEIGGSGRSAEVKEKLLGRLDISEAEQNDRLKSGLPRLGNQIDWARFYLAKSGYLDSSRRGVWALTEKGENTNLSVADIKKITRAVDSLYKPSGSVTHKTDEVTEDVETPVHIDHRIALLNTLKQLPPAGFERLCRHLLLESGFEEVDVTGRSGDGGIDGQGLLRVSKLVSMKVFFQCKRFRDAVGPGVVRDFRGALAGRAEKGIILTTSYFTSSAEQEAKRDGVVPIELVDGDRIVELFEEMEIGLTNPRTVYDIDDAFFGRFRQEKSTAP